MLLMTCKSQQYRNDCNLCSNDTACNVRHHYFLSSELLIYNPVDVKQHPKVLKAAVVTMISCGMEESWGIALIQKCLQKHL